MQCLRVLGIVQSQRKGVWIRGAFQSTGGARDRPLEAGDQSGESTEDTEWEEERTRGCSWRIQRLYNITCAYSNREKPSLVSHNLHMYTNTFTHTTVKKSGVSKICFLIKLIRSNSKDIYNVTKDFCFNKCCYFELAIHQRILKKCVIQKHYATQLFSTLILLINVSWAANQHIRMIVMAAENAALPSQEKKRKFQLY